VSEAEKAIKTLYGKETVGLVLQDLTAASQGSSESEAGWFELFSRRYWKGIVKFRLRLLPCLIIICRKLLIISSSVNFISFFTFSF
jgi:hypothetical protein